MWFSGWILGVGLILFGIGVIYRTFEMRRASTDRSLGEACLATGGTLIYVAALVAVCSWLSAPSAFGRDFGQWGGTDDAVRSWYKSLMQPDAPSVSCCGEADAYFCDDYRSQGGKALCTISDDRPDEPRGRPHIDIGTVIEIPQHKLKYDMGNPTGHSIVFLSRQGYVFCFVQGGGV